MASEKSETRRPCFDWSMTVEERKALWRAQDEWDHAHPEQRPRLTGLFLGPVLEIHCVEDADRLEEDREWLEKQRRRNDAFDDAREAEGHR